jgi:ribosomal protein L32
MNRCKECGREIKKGNICKYCFVEIVFEESNLTPKVNNETDNKFKI